MKILNLTNNLTNNRIKLFLYANRDIFITLATYLFMSVIVMAFAPGCANVEEAKELVAEIVDETETAELIIPPKEPEPDPEKISDLFGLKPGQKVSIMSFGTIDPVGTSLSDDFDGDGLSNGKESLGNFWAADYPEIETNIAPPVTMKITVMSTSGTQSDEIVSDISSSDFESRRSEGSEKFHQNELAERTIKTGSTTSSTTSEFNVNAGVSVGPFSLGGGGGESSTDTTTQDIYANQPFVNNIDRSSKSVSSSSSQNNARKFRSEKQSKTSSSTKIGPDAGKIRASLYIKNTTVNMPVKLSHILCSLLFESAEGQLIPIQSFRLRNPDYSIFTIDVYGNSEFGPYVIELSGLNTNEIEQAITKGYTPKIFIVDYAMTHVEDSNYKSTLASSFTGNNLRIIEENSKGRTALVKLIGPYIRSLYRVAAFDVSPDPSNICSPATVSSASLVSPGVSLKKILKRLSCSGRTMEFGHYIFDYTGIPSIGDDNKVYVENVKSIDGIANNFPCHETLTGFDFNNNPVSACVVRVKDLSETEVLSVSIWSVFSKGKFFNNKGYARDSSGAIRYFDSNQTIPMLQGINSMVWVGDNYDIAYMSMSDIVGKKNTFGLNPLETYVPLALNTRWSHKMLGNFPFYPNVKSVYLGKAALGEKIEFEITLANTWRLIPSFKISDIYEDYTFFEEFSYAWKKETSRLFLPGEAFDLEINLGSGGKKYDWFNILRTRNSSITDSNQVLINCGLAYNYITQVYKVCVQLPDPVNDYEMISQYLPNAGNDQMVDIFLRTTPNNAYRETLWPENYDNVKKLKGQLKSNAMAGSTIINVEKGTGKPGLNGTESGNLVMIGQKTYTIQNITRSGSNFSITLTSGLSEDHFSGEEVSIDAKLDYPNMLLAFKNTAFSDWNNAIPAGSGIPYSGKMIPTSTWPTCNNGIDNLTGVLSPLCQGYTMENFYSGYIGAGSFYNKWSAAPVTIPGLFHLNTGINLQATAKDFLVNENTTGDQRFPVSSGNGSTVLTVWVSGENNSIWGKLLDLNSGKSIGSEFQISTGNENNLSNPVISISNNKAFVAWSTRIGPGEGNIRGRIVNISNGNLIPSSSDFAISQNTANLQNYVKLSSKGDNALAVWSSDHAAAGNTDIYGRYINLTNGTPAGDDFLISSSNASFQFANDISLCGDKAIVTWDSNDNGTDRDIRVRLIDFNTGILQGAGDVLLSTSNTDIQYNSGITCGPNSALVTWASKDNGSDFDIRGRLINLGTGVPEGTSDFLVNTTISNDQFPAMGIAYGTRALVLWNHLSANDDYDIRGRVIDLETGNFSTSDDFLVSTENTGPQTGAVAASSNNHVLITWRSGTTLIEQDIRGRFYDLETLKFIGDFDFLISTTHSNSHAGHSLYISGNLPVVFWGSKDNGMDYDIRGSFVIPDYGINQFFSAPLIERNYSVKARILY
jgi:hypothetical protein